MYKRILVAYNGTLESRNALNECINLTRNIQITHSNKKGIYVNECQE